MTNLTPVQVATAAKRGGWPLALVPVATAVSLSENRDSDPDKLGDTTITTETWGPSVGLWQIRSLNAQRGTGGVRDEIANHDPVINAKHAYQIFREQGWTAWTDYRNSRYLAYMIKAGQAVSAAIASGWLTPLPTAAYRAGQQLGEAAQGASAGLVNTAAAAREGLAYVDAARKWLSDRHNWTRIAWFAAGGVLLVGALMQSDNGRQAVEQVQSLGGSAAKLAVTKGRAK